MPRLPDFTALGEPQAPRTRVPIVSDQSAQIIDQAGLQLGQTLRQIGTQLEDKQSQLEQTQARSALLVSDIQTRQSFEGDPDWKTYTQRYQEKMSQNIDATEQTITNPRDRALFRAQANLDLARGTAAMAEQAQRKRVDAGHANTVMSLDALRQSSLSAPDEGTRAAAVGAAQQLINASVNTGDLTAEQGAMLKKQWTASYSEGAVQMLPYANQIDLLSKPKGTVADFLEPDKREEMLQHAILAKHVEEERALALQKQQEEIQQKAIQNVFLQRMQNNQLTTQDVLSSKLAPFGSGSKEEFLRMLKPTADKTDPALFNELFARAHLPDGTTGKLVDENQLNQYVIAGRLSMEDLGKLRGEIVGNKTTDGQSEEKLKEGLYNVAKNTLVHSNALIGLQDPAGEENLQRFTSWFIGEYAKQRAAGKSPQQLLSPDSSDYLGTRLQSYVKSPQQIMQSVLQSATQAPAANAVPRKEGESADDYLKRIGKQ